MKVSEIMTKATVTDAAQDSLAEAAARMWNAQTGSLLVMEGEHLVGIVTERDVLRAIAHGSWFHAPSAQPSESITRRFTS